MKTRIISVLAILSLMGCSTQQQQAASALLTTGTQLASQLDPSAVPFLQAGAAIFQAYVGQTVPATVIDTGNSKVDAVLQKATSVAAVAQGDVSTIQNAINLLTGKTSMNKRDTSYVTLVWVTPKR